MNSLRGVGSVETAIKEMVRAETGSSVRIDRGHLELRPLGFTTAFYLDRRRPELKEHLLRIALPGGVPSFDEESPGRPSRTTLRTFERRRKRESSNVAIQSRSIWRPHRTAPRDEM